MPLTFLLLNFDQILICQLLMQADRELGSSGKSPEKLKGAGSFLMKVFGVLAVSTQYHPLSGNWSFIFYVLWALTFVFRERAQNVLEHYMWLVSCSKFTLRWYFVKFSLVSVVSLCWSCDSLLLEAFFSKNYNLYFSCSLVQSTYAEVL